MEIINAEDFCDVIDKKLQNEYEHEMQIVKECIEKACKDPSHTKLEILLPLSKISAKTKQAIEKYGYKIDNRRTGINEVRVLLIPDIIYF